ncbi:hypothetical protein [Martelella sp.]|uniref:hypothetical protein n=1 Tax=Martelella sp. TaxID=1969699 RepID=UPI0025BDE3B2|nr:hypothetical protein [Martelella sp.]
MTAKINKRFFQSTALASLSLLAVNAAHAQEAAGILTMNAAQEIRSYYGDPEDSTYSTGLTDRAEIGGLTADGSAFVGTVYRSYAQSIQSGFIWTAAGGVQPVGDRPANSPLIQAESYTSSDISADGSVIVGKAAGAIFGLAGAYRWNEAGGFQSLGTLPDGVSSNATAVSGDGNVVVGFDGFLSGESFRWTEAGGMQSLGFLPGGETIKTDQPTATNYDGSVVVGIAMTGDYKRNAFSWTEQTGMQALPTLDDKLTEANDISWDGSIIVGKSRKGYYDQAVRWVDGEIQSLGGLDGDEISLSSALGVSGNGAVAVGTLYSSRLPRHRHSAR